jgi:hypothetical protein
MDIPSHTREVPGILIQLTTVERGSYSASHSHPYVRRTLAISCEGRTTLPWFTMTLPTMMLPLASNRPSSAASRCSAARSSPPGFPCRT